MRQIGQIVDKSLSTVRNIVNKYESSKRMADLPTSGRSEKLSNHDVAKVCREVAKNISKEAGTEVSASQIRRALHSSGFFGRTPRKKPIISTKNKA